MNKEPSLWADGGGAALREGGLVPRECCGEAGHQAGDQDGRLAFSGLGTRWNNGFNAKPMAPTCPWKVQDSLRIRVGHTKRSLHGGRQCRRGVHVELCVNTK